MKLIFLDIDGVLNGQEFNKTCGSNSINRECAEHLNAIIAATDAKIVLSSAWRYMIPGAMRLVGFEYLLRTHGVNAENRLIGTTSRDEVVKDREDQISFWLAENGGGEGIESYVVLDDMCVGKHPQVQTGEKVGLTEEDVAAAIRILNSPPDAQEAQ